MFKVAVAPMMDCTDRHFRYLVRLISKNVVLYTEMVHAGAIVYGHRERFLKFHAVEHPIVIQFGGSDPQLLAEAAKIAEQYGYDQINLNVGCPSERVQSGRFGACLMAEPNLVADCVRSMRQAVTIPVTVKTRIGIDDQDSYELLTQFIKTVADAGCEHFIVHARKAWLKGLSPKENRTIPPLKYDIVHQLKKDFPALEIMINGGINTIETINQQRKITDGVMIGRAIYDDPYLLAAIERDIFDNSVSVSRFDILQQYNHYLMEEIRLGTPLRLVARHLLGLFTGLPHARSWRRQLGEALCKTASSPNILQIAEHIFEGCI